MAANQVVVDDPERLHRGVHGGRPHKAEAVVAQLRGEGLGLWGGGWERAHTGGRPRRARFVLPQEASQPDALLAEPDGDLSVGDRGADLGLVPDDPRVSEEPIDIRLAEA